MALRGRDRLLEAYRTARAYDLSEGGLDDARADVLRADSKRRAPGNANDDLTLLDGQQLYAARVLLEKWVENLVDHPLERFAHPQSMRNRAPERKRPRSRHSREPGLYSVPTMQPARTRLQVDVRRQQLLDLGLELFASQSYDELSIDEIARRAGVSKGLLYHYYRSKRAFYVAAVREAARQLLEETDVDKHGSGPEPDPEGQRAGLRAFIDYVSRHRVVYAFLLRGGIGTDPEVAEVLEETREALIDRMLTRLSRFGARADDPRARLKLRGWLGFLEAASLDWAERQELDQDAFLALLLRMSNFVFRAVLQPTEP